MDDHCLPENKYFPGQALLIEESGQESGASISETERFHDMQYLVAVDQNTLLFLWIYFAWDESLKGSWKWRSEEKICR